MPKHWFGILGMNPNVKKCYAKYFFTLKIGQKIEKNIWKALSKKSRNIFRSQILVIQ